MHRILLQAWGLNNREAALRLLPDADGDRANCELKVCLWTRAVLSDVTTSQRGSPFGNWKFEAVCWQPGKPALAELI